MHFAQLGSFLWGCIYDGELSVRWHPLSYQRTESSRFTQANLPFLIAKIEQALLGDATPPSVSARVSNEQFHDPLSISLATSLTSFSSSSTASPSAIFTSSGSRVVAS